METTHTQGEWLFSKGSTPHFQCQVYSQETGQSIAVTYNDEGQHNARLIAAAPELLEALKQFIHAAEHEGVINGRLVCALRNANEAIQKATQP